ncbi:tuftelin-interacting protein 11 [Sporothrix schenckii 1099-18]|uniref:Tuftelin-interacting protein 11 n=1 Tax=Sporothrix schenckii 1099-18 TaxID=1397361 RepID=A0A0F2M605_SPOSC|nr:tuftelin-interacting protein 11 [Sporothrix schenckii 1099-18]KJR84240.1 tuftelin-interacting protein 11 [Sporothrix schenckii 1099-18]
MDFSFGAAAAAGNVAKGAAGADAYSSSDSGSDDDGNTYRMPSTNPGDGEFGDFNPRKRRRTGRNAKESAALGIFGSDSEDDHTQRRWKQRQPLRKQGMSFVSSGAKKESDDEDEDEESEEDEKDDHLGDDGDNNDESEEDGRFGLSSAAQRAAGVQDGEDYTKQDGEEDDYDDETPGIGLGFGSVRGGLGRGASDNASKSAGGAGLGFVPASFQSSRNGGRNSHSNQRRPPPSFQPASSASHDDADIDTQNPLGQGFVPSSAYDPVLRPQGQSTKEPPLVARPSAFSSKPTRGGAGGGARGGSSFNAKSFGARMMAKMGFVEGRGLGSEGQGRNIIIEANLRPQGVGLGAVREKSEKERQEEKRQARLRGEAVIDSDEEERKVNAAAAARRKKALASGGSGSGGTNSGTSTPRRAKKKYMTMDEARRAAPGLHIPEAFTPILDMTGPGKRLLTSSSGLMTPTSGTAAGTASAASPFVSGSPAAGAETAEQVEARKLARRAQSDFMAILEEWQSLQNRKAFAELQAQQARQELAELEVNLQAHTAMTSAFSKLSVDKADHSATAGRMRNGEGDTVDTADATDTTETTNTWRPTWDHTIAQLQAAAETIPPASMSEMRDALADICVAALHPLFKQAIEAWAPLQDPNQHLVDGLLSIQGLLGFGPDAAAARTLLEADEAAKGRRLDPFVFRKHKAATATPYEAVMYTLWLPHVSAAVRTWDAVHDADSVLALYEAWLPVLPGFVRAHLLEQDIVRRLDEAVARWEPKRRRHSAQTTQNLPHLWLFPWLPYLPARHVDPSAADGLVVQVKRKFRQLIDVWEFYRGVVPGLRQWKAVLRPSGRGAGDAASTSAASSASSARDQWRPLVMSHVLPSMARYVRAQFRVDPRDQAGYLEVITGEFQWLALLAPEMVGEVMVADVFPMWHEALYHLLTDADESLDRIGQWFQWWADNVFPASIQRLPSVAAEFERGLGMINEALDIGVVDATTGVYDADRVRQFLAPPSKGPALKASSSLSSSRHNGHHSRYHHGHHRQADKETPTSTPAAPENEEMSIRHYVEEWCESNDVQFIPERKKVHAEGRPLYRLTTRGDGRGGVLAYFKGVRLYAETKKGPLEIRVDREDDWTKLLSMAQ